MPRGSKERPRAQGECGPEWSKLQSPQGAGLALGGIARISCEQSARVSSLPLVCEQPAPRGQRCAHVLKVLSILGNACASTKLVTNEGTVAFSSTSHPYCTIVVPSPRSCRRQPPTLDLMSALELRVHSTDLPFTASMSSAYDIPKPMI